MKMYIGIVTLIIGAIAATSAGQTLSPNQIASVRAQVKREKLVNVFTQLVQH